ncbi:hypothetical protein AHAS_Ahas09G0152500 [Arachis hypogaea]
MDEDDTNVEPMFDDHDFDEGYNIDSFEDIGIIEFWNIRDEDVCHFHFSDVDIAFEFYNRYARTRGFSARKNRTRKSCAGVLKLKKFVGISVGQIYRALANHIGGYEYLSFTQRDMYNKIAKQRRQLRGDAYAVLKYLEDQATNDLSLYFNHHMDADGTLRNLFWCDGLSMADYSLFGNVLPFDATYKRNKYMCPLVIFSGVNHHNQTIVFAAALICDEEKDTYRGLLQQLKVEMNEKAPVLVIMDGDPSMKFSIEKEFPSAHHRLCD